MENVASPLPKMSGTDYEPKEGDIITVELPNERTRAKIEKVISDAACIARIMQYTTAFHSHPYKKDDLIACKFEEVGVRNQGWRLVSDREMAEADAEAASQVPVAEVEPEKKKKKGK